MRTQSYYLWMWVEPTRKKSSSSLIGMCFLSVWRWSTLQDVRIFSCLRVLVYQLDKSYLVTCLVEVLGSTYFELFFLVSQIINWLHCGFLLYVPWGVKLSWRWCGSRITSRFWVFLNWAAQPAHVKNKQELGCHVFDWDKFRARKGGSVFIGVSSENPSTHPEFLVILQVLACLEKCKSFVGVSCTHSKSNIFCSSLSRPFKTCYFEDQNTPAIQVHSPLHWRVPADP